jgi:hypothetical protein
MKTPPMQDLSFVDPKEILAGLRWIEENLPLEELSDKARSLRTRQMRPFLEARQAALFCYGLSTAMQQQVSFAMHEEDDYDALASFERDKKRVFVPIQLKEVVPQELNASASLQGELNKLKKYTDSKGLVVAFHLNRRCTLDIKSISAPHGVVAEIWIVASTNEEMSEWALIGNIINDECYTYRFSYPDASQPYLPHIYG